MHFKEELHNQRKGKSGVASELHVHLIIIINAKGCSFLLELSYDALLG